MSYQQVELLAVANVCLGTLGATSGRRSSPARTGQAMASRPPRVLLPLQQAVKTNEKLIREFYGIHAVSSLYN
jgi:hypothetical protein